MQPFEEKNVLEVVLVMLAICLSLDENDRFITKEKRQHQGGGYGSVPGRREG